VAAVPLRKELTVPIEQEAGWAVELVWMLWKIENVLALLELSHSFSVFQPVAYILATI